MLLSSYVFLQLFLLGWKGTLSRRIAEPTLVPHHTVALQCKPSLTPALLKVTDISTRRVWDLYVGVYVCVRTNRSDILRRHTTAGTPRGGAARVQVHAGS